MASSRRSLRIISAIVMLVAAVPARAEEVAYLMYVKGSEGPPATPMRVLWDVRGDDDARITIDLGAKYEAALTKLALPRVLKYDARREQARFVVRDTGFTHFVQTVATSLVQTLLTASAVPGAWAQRPEAEVKDATLTITPAPRPAPLEVTTWLYVTYLAPQKSGQPKAKDLIKGDVVFVGRPEDASPGEAGQTDKR